MRPSGLVGRRLPELLLICIAIGLLLAPLGLRSGQDPSRPLPLDDLDVEEQVEATYTASTCERASFVPGETVAPCQRALIAALFTGLTSWDPVAGRYRLRVAAEIESEDLQTFTVRLDTRYRFHDGTPVTASSFANAWNHAAYEPNGLTGGSLMEIVEGYPALRCRMPGVPPDCAASPPRARRLSGVEVVDAHTLRVRLARPARDFPLVLSSPALAPLPDVFFDDPQEFAARPIGNGPYRLDGEVADGGDIRLVAADTHPYPPGISRVTFRPFSQPTDALAALAAGDLDVAASMTVPDGGASADVRWRTTAGAAVNYLVLPAGDPRFEDPAARAAVSHALDREALAAHRPGEEPATGLLPPSVPGAAADACGRACRHDRARAAELFARSGAGSEPLELHFNTGAGHEGWVEEAARQLRGALGVEVVLRPSELEDLVGALRAGRLTGLVRLGWQGEYPSPDAYLRPLFSRGHDGAPSWSGHEEPSLLPRLDRAAAEGPQGDAIVSYLQVERRLLDQLDLVPVFFSQGVLAHSDRVEGAEPDQWGAFDPAAIRPAGR